MRLAVLAALLPFLGGWDLLRSPNKAVEEGNARLKAGKPEEALSLYDRAAQRLPGDAGVRFNRGAALHALKRYDEAAQEFLRATEAREMGFKASAFYNLGNAFFSGAKYKEAVEAYKRSLALDPKDVRSKWNLELALRKVKEEEKNKGDQGGDKDDKKQDDKKQDDKDKKREQEKDGKDEKKPEPQGADDRKPEPSPADQKQEPKAPEQAPQPQPTEKPEAREADAKEMEAVLDSLEKSPKALEQMRARLRAVRRRPVKDW